MNCVPLSIEICYHEGVKPTICLRWNATPSEKALEHYVANCCNNTVVYRTPEQDKAVNNYYQELYVRFFRWVQLVPSLAHLRFPALPPVEPKSDGNFVFVNFNQHQLEMRLRRIGGCNVVFYLRNVDFDSKLIEELHSYMAAF